MSGILNPTSFVIEPKPRWFLFDAIILYYDTTKFNSYLVKIPEDIELINVKKSHIINVRLSA